MSPLLPIRLLPIPLLLPIAMATVMTVAPSAATSARAQTLRDAGKAAAEAQTTSCVAKAQELLKACEEEEEEAEKADETPGRSGLGWTGIGLLSAGGALAVSAVTVDRWRSCGPQFKSKCQDIERRQGIGAGVMLATGLTFLLVDEFRRHPQPYPRAKRQTAIAIGPRAIQVRMRF